MSGKVADIPRKFNGKLPPLEHRFKHHTASNTTCFSNNNFASSQFATALDSDMANARNNFYNTRDKLVTGFMSLKSRMIRKSICFVLCLLVIAVQFGLLDYYFVRYTGSNDWWGFVAADAVVLAIMIWLLTCDIRYNIRCLKDSCACTEDNLRYRFVAWCAYSGLISAKICTAAYVFFDKLSTAEMFGIQYYRMTLSMSTIVFLLLVLSHHYTKLKSSRQQYLSFLANSITLDLLDSISFLDIIMLPKLRTFATPSFKIAVLVFACVNFIFPTFALLKLRYSKRLPQFGFLPYEKLYDMAYFMLVNVPYLVIRIYTWQGSDDFSGSIFLLKNIVGVIVAIRELWLSYLLYKEAQVERSCETAVDDVAANGKH